MSVLDRQHDVEDLVRLRRVRRGISALAASDLDPVIARKRRMVGEAVPGTVAARVLHVSHTAVARWMEAGELLRGPTKSSQLYVDDLVEVAEGIEALRSTGRTRHALSTVLRSRLAPACRSAAAEAGVEPALVAHWIRSGFLRGERRADGYELGPNEPGWLVPHGRLARTLHRAAMEHDGIELLVLFGSTARGDDLPASDVDLLVAGPITENLTAMMRLRGELVERLARRVDLLPLTEAQHAPAVLAGALADGRPLKDASGAWDAVRAEGDAIRTRAMAERASYPEREAAVVTSLLRP